MMVFINHHTIHSSAVSQSHNCQGLNVHPANRLQNDSLLSLYGACTVASLENVFLDIPQELEHSSRFSSENKLLDK